MAAKGWMTQVGAAAGVAAGAGAAQLGLGYGLGVVAWPAAATPDDSVWLGSLGWAMWIAASATVFGAVIAARLGPAPRGMWRFALAASAAVGALLTVALVALPARDAVRPDQLAPGSIAAGYAVGGVVLGLAIACFAVVSRPVAANLIATAAWLWALAIAAVILDVFWHRPSATYLGSWQFAEGAGGPEAGTVAIGTIFWPSAVLTLAAAFLIGLLAATPAAMRGHLAIGAASSGAVGPLLVAAAFLALAPQLPGALGSLQSAYLIAPYAVLAGLAGSSTAVGVARRSAARRDTPPDHSSTAGDAELAAVASRKPRSMRKATATRGSTVAPPPSDPPVALINPPSAEVPRPRDSPATPEPSAPLPKPPAAPATATPAAPEDPAAPATGTPTAPEDPAAPAAIAARKAVPAKATPAAKAVSAKVPQAKAPAPQVKAPAPQTKAPVPQKKASAKRPSPRSATAKAAPATTEPATTEPGTTTKAAPPPTEPGTAADDA